MEFVNQWLPGDGAGVTEPERVGRERPEGQEEAPGMMVVFTTLT